MPLTILSGVNIEGKNVIFGIALISSESSPDYEWILQNLRGALGEKRPSVIITDGDSS